MKTTRNIPYGTHLHLNIPTIVGDPASQLFFSTIYIHLCRSVLDFARIVQIYLSLNWGKS
jgi:hypothetical protein